MARQRGFTLVELMIVVAVVAILAAFAYPLYTEQVAKSRRSNAIQVLQDFSLRQERWRSNNATYGTCDQVLGASCATLNASSEFYNVAVTANSNTATGYVMTATPEGAQTGDRCGTFTFTMANGTLSKTAAEDDCI